MAVFPTPGSPIKTGLFLERRERTWIRRRISSSLPITGSSFPNEACAVKSRPYFSKTLELLESVLAKFSSVICSVRFSLIVFSKSWGSKLKLRKQRLPMRSSSANPTRRCSVEINLSCQLSRQASALSNIISRLGPRYSCSVLFTFGWRLAKVVRSTCKRAGSIFALSRSVWANPSSSRESMTCSTSRS